MNDFESNEIDTQDKITELVYITRGLAYVLLYAIPETSPENDPGNLVYDLFTNEFKNTSDTQ